MVGWKHQRLSTLKCCLSVTRELASASRGSGQGPISVWPRSRAARAVFLPTSVILVPLDCFEQFNNARYARVMCQC
jgi:hypothetical protein